MWKFLAAGLGFAAACQPLYTSAETVRIALEGTYPPFSETLPSGDIVGFDVDIAKALCAEMQVSCEMIGPVAWEGMIPGLLEGRYDAIVASMSITEERKQVVDFTDRYYKTPGAFVGPKTLQIEPTVEGLTGKTVGVQVATVSACFVEKTMGNAVTLKQYDTQENANLDLTAGRLDVVFADVVTLVGGFLNRPEGARFEMKGDPIYDEGCMGEGIGIALRKEDASLTARFNAALKAIRDKGVYQRINEKYFDFDLYGE